MRSGRSKQRLKSCNLAGWMWLVMLAVAGTATMASAAEKPFGEFLTRLRMESTKQGAGNFRLLEDFEYRDRKGDPWVAPAGTLTNGASIPRVVPLISPWSGNYKEAAVIHDHFTTTKSRPSKVVHGVFYDGMRANGVPVVQAGLMYAAVLLFGPHWSDHEANYLVCSRRLAKQRQVPIAEVAAMCSREPFKGKGQVLWRPVHKGDVRGDVWSDVQNAISKSTTREDVRRLAIEKLRQNTTHGDLAYRLGLLE